MAGDELWTLEQLSERVADALTVDYDGQPSGRVREVPNGRTIRWYTTIGLVDRPAAMRGRTALYGRRHLLQLVAVKRLQAAGRPLAAVQQELLGATDATLERVARVRVNGSAPTPATRSGRGRFWTAAPAAGEPSDLAGATPPSPKKHSVRSSVTRVHGIRLNDTATVLLGAARREPTADELTAIEAAAAPLLDLLDRLGLEERDDHAR